MGSEKISSQYTDDHTESWSCSFWFTNLSGYRQKGSMILYSKSKNNGDSVEKYFKKHYPEYELIRIKFQ